MNSILSLPHDAIALAGSVVGDPFMRLAAAFVLAAVVARLARPVAAVTVSLELLVFKQSELATDPVFYFTLSRARSQSSHKNRSYIVL
jgi:hypothetical protein